MFGKVLQMVEKGKIDEYYFNHYIEAYANWDINSLIQLIFNGYTYFFTIKKNYSVFSLIKNGVKNKITIFNQQL